MSEVAQVQASASTSTLPTVEAALVAALAAEGVTLHRAWPGGDADSVMVFLTDIDWDTYEIAAINAGRRRRDESYGIGFEVWAFRDTSPVTAGDAKDEAMTLFATIEDVCADDTTLGVPCVRSVVPAPSKLEVVVFQKGWAAVLSGSFQVEARLT